MHAHTCIHVYICLKLTIWVEDLVLFSILHLSYIDLTLDVRIQLKTKFMFANLLCPYRSPRRQTLSLQMQKF